MPTVDINKKTLFKPFPILTTARLVLRALAAADLADLYQYASDPLIDRHTPWDHYHTMDEAKADLTDYVAQYDRDGMGVWGVQHRADGKLIGICNFTYWQTRHRRAEIGYTIARPYWGQGLATEAVRAVLTFGFERMDLARIEAVCTPDNTASERVLQKAGMQYEGLLRNYQVWRGTPQDLKMYAIIRADTSTARP
jgi:ribosomal-protein-alanine N-acetyltransferase